MNPLSVGRVHVNPLVNTAGCTLGPFDCPSRGAGGSRPCRQIGGDAVNSHKGNYRAGPRRSNLAEPTTPSGPSERLRILTLHAEAPDTVLAARNMTRDTLIHWGLPSLVDDARVVVSELVTNAVKHAVADDVLAMPGATSKISLMLRMWSQCLLIGVADEDSTPPTFPTGEAFSPAWAGDLPEAMLPDTGRGLLIVHRLVDAVWWYPQSPGGKVVVCRFDLDSHKPMS